MIRDGEIQKSIKGKLIILDSVRIENKDIIITGKVFRIARLNEEWDEWVEDPEQVAEELKRSRSRADLFTFVQRFSETKPKYNYYMEWDNVAAIQIKDYNHWWTKQINKNTRNAVRKAEKRGVVVKTMIFNEETIRGISNIYNEVPIRQGKPFWHYGKSLELIEKEHSTYLDRSCFIGAYFEDELIGFIKLVRGEGFMDIMNILSKVRHREKAPVNILMAKAIEYCEKENIQYLTYGPYIYGKKGRDSLTDFKEHNGFKKIDFPRYYFPLTIKGNMALRLKLHRPIADLFPKIIYKIIIDLRKMFYSLKYSKNNNIHGSRLR
jgi:hypothetical protein